MRWSFYFTLRGRAMAFAVAVVFILVALGIFALAPAPVESALNTEIALWSIRLLGAVFMVLGLGALVLAGGDVYFEHTNPAARTHWFWRGNFLLGILGALCFAVPATLLFPIFLLAYLLGPNLLFPPNVDPTNNLIVSLIFTIIGIVCLVALYVIARSIYRQRRV
jgi:hypothetical protein